MRAVSDMVLIKHDLETAMIGTLLGLSIFAGDALAGGSPKLIRYDSFAEGGLQEEGGYMWGDYFPDPETGLGKFIDIGKCSGKCKGIGFADISKLSISSSSGISSSELSSPSSESSLFDSAEG